MKKIIGKFFLEFVIITIMPFNKGQKLPNTFLRKWKNVNIGIKWEQSKKYGFFSDQNLIIFGLHLEFVFRKLLTLLFV